MGSLIPRHQEQVGVGHTYDLWRGFPRDEIFTFKDRNVGYGIQDHFTSFNMAPTADDSTTAQFGSNGAQIYKDASSTCAMLTGTIGGGLRLFNTADNEEVWMQYGGLTGAPFVLSDAAATMRELVFECAFRVSVTTITKAGWFIGLGEEGLGATNTIADAGTLADKDLFGLFKPEGNTTGVDLVYNLSGGGGVVEHAADWQTIVAATWYKFGFRYHVDTGVITPWFGVGTGATAMIEYTANNITATDIASAGTDKFPDAEEMSPLFGAKNAHADDFSLDLLFVECAQLV
ncbi:MAG: hypothetical protein ACYS5V_04175 [Planctomycetota bacterium]|jgi:hypothetical protein